MMVEEDKQRIGKEGPVNKSNGWVNLETSVYWCWTWNQIPGWKFSTSDSLKSKLSNARRASKQDNKTGYTEGKRFPTWDETLKTYRHNNLGSNRERVKAIGGTAGVDLFPQGQWIAKANTSDM